MNNQQALEAFQAELDMQALEEAMWEKYQAEEAIEPVKHWATEWENNSLLDYRKEEF